MEVKGSLTAKSIITAGLRVNEKLDMQVLSADVQLTKYSPKHICYYTNSDRVVTLPDATTLPAGWEISIYSKNTSENDITINDASNANLTTIIKRKMATMILLDNSTVAGLWKVVSYGGSSGSGSGTRNVITTNFGPVITISGNTASVGNCIATIAEGFDPEGDPIDVYIKKQDTDTVNLLSGATSYLYIDDTGTIIVETHRQKGGQVLPPTSNYDTGTIYYSISDEKNYKLGSSGWAEYPCVAIGEVDTSNNITVYGFNFWWWLYETMAPRSQNFYDASSTISSIVLDSPVADPNLLYINVDNALLLQSEYTIGSDMRTVTFNTPVAADTLIEARWNTDVSNVAVLHGRTVGEVYYSQSSLKLDNPGALPLFTGESVLVSNYTALYAFLLRNASSLVTNETTYNALIADTTKDCPYYMIKDGYIHLPLLRHFIKVANITDGITQGDAGLPNITGSIDVSSAQTVHEVFGETHESDVVETGALSGIYGEQYDVPDAVDIDQDLLRGIKFDASDSNSIYGASNTVTPAHSTLYPWVSYINTIGGITTATGYVRTIGDTMSGALNVVVPGETPAFSVQTNNAQSFVVAGDNTTYLDIRNMSGRGIGISASSSASDYPVTVRDGVNRYRVLDSRDLNSATQAAIMPDWTSGVQQYGATDYTATSNGWLFILINGTLSGNILVFNGGTYMLTTRDDSAPQDVTVWWPVSAGDTYNMTSAESYLMVFYPCKGA